MSKCIPSTEITAVIAEYQSIQKKKNLTGLSATIYPLPCLSYYRAGISFSFFFFLALSSKVDSETIIIRKIRQGQALPVYPVLLQTVEYSRQLERNIDLSNTFISNRR